MPTGSGLWHFLYRLVRKFIRSVVISEKDVAATSRNWNWKTRHIIMMHFGNGDKPNRLVLLVELQDIDRAVNVCICLFVCLSVCL